MKCATFRVSMDCGFIIAPLEFFSFCYLDQVFLIRHELRPLLLRYQLNFQFAVFRILLEADGVDNKPDLVQFLCLVRSHYLILLSPSVVNCKLTSKAEMKPAAEYQQCLIIHTILEGSGVARNIDQYSSSFLVGEC